MPAPPVAGAKPSHRPKNGRYSLPFPLSTPSQGIDQGVDFDPKGPVRAIAAGRIYHVSGPHAFKTPFGPGEAVYEHLDHPITIHGHTYYNVYYAEQTALVKVGHRVRAGQVVMSGGEDELGFARRDMSSPGPQGQLTVVHGPHGRYSEPTTEGKDFYAFLQWIAHHR
jgi:hypothetical protein